MKKLIFVLLSMSIFTNIYSQFKVNSLGELRLYTNNMGPWDRTFITYPNSDYSACYMVSRNGSTTFYVRGDGYILARGTYINSDSLLKTDIQNVDNIEKLYKIQAKSYRFKDNSNYIDSTTNRINSIKGKVDQKDLDESPLSYGFLAQDIKKLYPEIITSDENDLLSINYTAFIPLLIEALKQQKIELDALQKIVYSQELELNVIKKMEKECCAQQDDLKLKNANKKDNEQYSDLSQKAKLFDNNPNPFSTETIIKYLIKRIPRGSASGYRGKIENLKVFMTV